MTSSAHNLPLVTIGVPVFNEETFIETTLKSLIAQNYGNLEIIVSDNCSTDGTAEICDQYRSKHPGLTLHISDANIGSLPNFIRVFGMAKGKYFMWAAGHDLWSDNYITECVDALESRNSAVLAFGSSSWIDNKGEPLGREYGWSDTRGMSAAERFYTVFWGNMNPILGLIRRDVLLATPIVNTVGSDLIMLTGLALQGEFVHATRCHWNRREFRMEASHKEKIARYKTADQGFTTSRITHLFPLLRLPYELLKLVIFCNQPIMDKVTILFSLLPCFVSRYLAGKRKNYVE